MIILALQDVKKSFGTHEVLKSVSFTLQEGERMGMVGVNGSGKSTLMKIIAGLETADDGSVNMQKGLRIGYLAQQGALTGDETVQETLESVFEPQRRMEEELRALEQEMAVSGTDPEALLADWQAYAAARGMSLDAAEGHAFTVVSAKGDRAVTVGNPEGAIPCETVQKFLDDFLAGHPSAGIDYIHGDSSLRRLASAPDTVGFLLPEIDKHTFFEDVKTLGVLPRKTFSMGEADEKRFYMEAKQI